MINSSEKSRKTFTSKSVDFTQDDESYMKAMADNQDGKFVEVLGVNTKADKFLFNFTELVKFANTLPVTKRSLLKISAKVFDPLGFLSPSVIQLKCMLQELCVEKIDWDRELQGDWLSKWTSFLSELESLNKVTIPRCYFITTSKPISVQLHGFGDASKQACAAVVYLRWTCRYPFVVFQDKSSPSQTANNSSPRVVGGLHSRETNERRSELSTRKIRKFY